MRTRVQCAASGVCRMRVQRERPVLARETQKFAPSDSENGDYAFARAAANVLGTVDDESHVLRGTGCGGGGNSFLGVFEENFGVCGCGVLIIVSSRVTIIVY